MAECYEPGCTRPATKEWNGTPLCYDCYDKYRQEYSRMLQDIEDLA